MPDVPTPTPPALPEPLQTCKNCFNADFKFPKLPDPGLPNFALGQSASCLFGINLVLGFLPPDPHNLPTIPKPDVFLKAFLPAINIPKPYPSFSGFGLTIPGSGGGGKFPFDISGMFKLILVLSFGNFKMFEFVLKSIINLNPKLPTLDFAIGILRGLAVDIGLPDIKIECFAKMAITLITGGIPV